MCKTHIYRLRMSCVLLPESSLRFLSSLPADFGEKHIHTTGSGLTFDMASVSPQQTSQPHRVAETLMQQASPRYSTPPVAVTDNGAEFVNRSVTLNIYRRHCIILRVMLRLREWTRICWTFCPSICMTHHICGTCSWVHTSINERTGCLHCFFCTAGTDGYS